MKTNPFIERFVYALVVVLSLATLWLVLNAPVNFLSVHAVYQGF